MSALLLVSSALLKGVPTIDLAKTLYALRATIYDPTRKADVNLPPHYWALFSVEDENRFVTSRVSDANGICLVPSIPPHFPKGDYALGFYPFPRDVRNAYLSQREAWIDLDTNQWAQPHPHGNTRIDRRRLLRIPSWTSLAKATRFGGGFVDAPPKGKAYFHGTGRLKRAEMENYGTEAAPWRMALDHGWIRARVRYHFFNLKEGKEELCPPGLVVEAFDDDNVKLGAGTAVDVHLADGTVYVLVARSRADWHRVHFTFTTPKGAHIDVTDPAVSPDERLLGTPASGYDPNRYSLLPARWHSLGMRATYQFTEGAAAGTPRPWRDVRIEIGRDASASNPVISFHLDDTVLWDARGAAEVKPATRLTLFDHLLAIRDPDPQRPHWSQVTISHPLVAAKVLFATSASPTPPTTFRDRATRLICVEGTFFDLKEKRVTGTGGKTMYLGARAAVANDHPYVNYSQGCPFVEWHGRYELHYIETKLVKDGETNRELAHLLLYIGSEIRGESDVAPDVPPAFYAMLTEAAVRLSPGHPGTTEPRASATAPHTSKQYVLVPKDLANRHQRVIRVRAFFGTRTDGKHTFAIKLTKDPAKPPARTRSFVNAKGDEMTFYDSWLVPPPVPALGVATDADGIWHTESPLAHEFGHALGNPDDYAEVFNINNLLDPAHGGGSPPAPYLPHSLQYKGWKSSARPYYTDIKALMSASALLRLRYMWHHVQALNEEKAFSELTLRPFVMRHNGYPDGGLEYQLPATHVGSPLHPMAEGGMSGGHALLTIFPLGDDEGAVEGMFPTNIPPNIVYTPRKPADRLDGVVVVSIHYRFIFDPSVVPFERWYAMYVFHCWHYGMYYEEWIRFILVGGSRLKRIAIVLLPHYAYGPSLGDGRDRSRDEPGFVLRIDSRKPKSPEDNVLLQDSAPDTIRLGLPDLHAWPLLRKALGKPSWTPGPPGGPPRLVNHGPITQDTFEWLAKRVDELLGDIPGTRKVQPL